MDSNDASAGDFRPRSSREAAEWAAAETTRPALPALRISKPPRPPRLRPDIWMARAGELARGQRLPLLLVTLVTLGAQAILFSTHPPISLSPDSGQYLARAASLAHFGPLADVIRPPGYPLFLVTIFLATGVNLPAVVAAQTILTVLTVYEVYLLGWRISGAAWLAAAAAALAGVNVYIIDWEFSIRDETLAMWLSVTAFLVAQRLLVTPVARWRWTSLFWLALLSVALILTRPSFILLPAGMMVGMVALWLRSHADWRRRAARLALAGVAAYAVTGAYIVANGVQNGYYGMSNTSGLNLMGKIMLHRLDGLSVSPEFQPMQRVLITYENAGGGVNPVEFAGNNHYDVNNFAPMSAYEKNVFTRHPLAFAVAVAEDSYTTWLDSPILYAQGTYTRPLNLLRLIGRVSLLTYLLLPLLLGWTIYRLWRKPGDAALQVQALLLWSIIVAIVTVGLAGYIEWYRLRSTLDWAYLLVLTFATWDVARLLAQRFDLRRFTFGRRRSLS